MRQIGHFDTDRDARVFCDYLYVQGIENEAEREGNRWAIWVRSDDDLPKAKQILDEFRAHPNDPRFEAGSPAAKLREHEKKQQAAYEKRVIEARSLFPGIRGYGFGVVTYALIAASVVVFFISHMGDNLGRVSALTIAHVEADGDVIRWIPGWHDIRRGEVWRLVTPIFIHFGFLHIFFNMLWLRDLGSMFEGRLRSWYFALFVIVVGAGSNYAQYFITHRPNFGGMSGVIYGLIGYAWIRGRLDPAAGIGLDRQTILFALIWFVVCFTGWAGPVANIAHGSGLIIGMVWGFIDAKLRRA